MNNECTCALGADECTGDSGVFHPLQAGGSCATRSCQKKELHESLERDTEYMLDVIQRLKSGENL